MFDLQTQSSLRSVLTTLSEKFSPDFLGIRVPLALILSERIHRRHSLIDFLIDAISNCFFLFRSFTLNKFFTRGQSHLDSNYIFVVDHNREPLINIFKDLIGDTSKSDFTLITINKSVYKKVNAGKEHPIIYINSFTTLSIDQINYGREIMRELKILDPIMSRYETFSIFCHVLKIIIYRKTYENILTSNLKAVLTLCDANLHEHIVTCVAKRKAIATTTLQHGMINPLWFPIISDNFLVWNNHTKQICQEKFGVDPSKMIVVGNPFHEHKPLVKKRSDKLTITYIVTNWGESENKLLFEVFMLASRFKNVNLIVKLRPNPPKKMLSMYELWLSNYSSNSATIIYQDDIHSVLTKTDLIVTFHSGVPIDGIMYGVPSILLDIFADIELKDLVDHYEDCTIAKNEKSYIELIDSVVHDDLFFGNMVKRAESCKNKYFPEGTKKEIIDYMRSSFIS